MKNNNASIFLIVMLILLLCACESTEPNETPHPKVVTDMEGIWELDLSSGLKTDSASYVLYIQNGTMEIRKSKSTSYPYYFQTVLVDAILRCKKGQTWLWEVPLEDPSVVAYRAIVILGFNFTIESPLGTLNFECSAGWNQSEITDASRWKGRVNVDNPLTGIGNDGTGTFSTNKK